MRASLTGLVNAWLQRCTALSGRGKDACHVCGRCCELFGGNLRTSRTDLKRWQEAGREDLLRRVNHLGWIWIDPETGKRRAKCPYLRRTGPEHASCGIHDLKPDMCRDYPTLAHGKRCVRGVVH